MTPKRTIRTDRARETFLNVLRATCNVSDAARTAGIGRTTAYEWRSEPAFAQAWDDAEDEAKDALEREAWRRGVEGCDKPIVYKGKVTGKFKEYSDRMLELLLKAHRPEKYRERVGEIAGPLRGLAKTKVTHTLDDASMKKIMDLIK